MAPHINGPLYYEKMGRSGPVMIFVHPNPMDQSCWIYQMAHFSTWYRCLAVDIPGYGKSPSATPELTRNDMAQALWEVVDAEYPGEPTILVGCSVGASLVPHMYHLRPQQSKAIVVCGTGYRGPGTPSPFAERYRKEGIEYRWDFTFEDFSAAFNTTPMATYFAEIFTERNGFGDLDSIVYQLTADRPGEEFFNAIKCPMTIISGSVDYAHERAFKLKELVPGCEMKIIHGAGHACQFEQPWLFDQYMLDFLKRNALFPGLPKVGALAAKPELAPAK